MRTFIILPVIILLLKKAFILFRNELHVYICVCTCMPACMDACMVMFNNVHVMRIHTCMQVMYFFLFSFLS